VEDLFHPPRSFAAWRALPTRFMGKEPGDVEQHVDDARLVVEHRDGRRSQSKATDLARAVEVEHGVEFGLRHNSHAIAARNAAFPAAARMFVDQIANRDAER